MKKTRLKMEQENVNNANKMSNINSNIEQESAKLSRAAKMLNRTRRRSSHEGTSEDGRILPRRYTVKKTTVILVSLAALLVSMPPQSSIFLLSNCDQSPLSTHQITPANATPTTTTSSTTTQQSHKSSTADSSSSLPATLTLHANPIMSALVAEQPITSSTVSSTPAAAAAPISASLVMSTREATQQLDASNNNNNVILIKYANVTGSKPIDSEELDNFNDIANQLQVFRLTDGEPLSVSVIQSKFSASIRVFDVSFNRLKSLPKDLFCPLSNEVRVLNTSYNLLENFDCLGLISQSGQLCLSDLRQLDMSHNLIRHLPATSVATLHNLQVLDLSHNLIDALDELSLSSLIKLSKLSLAHNRLVQLPARLFHKSSSMRHLQLQHNKLELVITNQSLLGLKSLEEIDLSHNNLSQISEFSFLDKQNLTRVDLSHNQIRTLAQGVLSVSSVNPSNAMTNQQQHARSSFSTGARQRLTHNGQLVMQSSQQEQSHNHLASVLHNHQNNLHASFQVAQFYLAQNPFLCDCQLDWLRNLHDLQQQQLQHQIRTRSSRLRPASSSQIFPPNNYQSEQSISNGDDLFQTNNISSFEFAIGASHRLARVADLDLIKCQASFKKQQSSNGIQVSKRAQHKYHFQQHALAPSGDDQHNWQQLAQVEPANFLCRYKSHCFALCQCCEFDACDCEMICPPACHCYYDSTWQTNVIDCSNSNHTSVPDRIPMDVSGLFLDGNQIESLRPSNLIARKSLKSLYLNSSQLQFIANRSFNGLIELETLHLNDNLLTRLQGFEFEPLSQLKSLYLQSNRLEHIEQKSFIYLRSLEVLDLSNNRLTTQPNLELLSAIGSYNIRMRHLSIGHNWWSCQCELIRKLRDILMRKFLANGNQVSVDDRAQLRCYYNATTIGPLILDQQQHQAPFATILNVNIKQQQLTEVNGCSDFPATDQSVDLSQFRSNPPQLSNWFQSWPAQVGNQPIGSDQPRPTHINSRQSNTNDQFDQADQSNGNNPFGLSSDQAILEPNLGLFAVAPNLIQQQQENGNLIQQQPTSNGNLLVNSSSVSSMLLLVMGFLSFLLVGGALFVFVRQQQHTHANQHHFRQQTRRRGPKSSTGSTVSSHSSSTDGSSTGVESLGGAKLRNPNLHLHQTTIVAGGAFGISQQAQHQQQLIINRQQQQQQQQQQTSLHHTNLIGTSSQSNIYAALVSSPSSIIGQQAAGGQPINQLQSSNSIVYGGTQRSHYYASGANNSHQYNSPLESHYNLQQQQQQQQQRQQHLVGNVITSSAMDSNGFYAGVKSSLGADPPTCHDELGQWGVSAGSSRNNVKHFVSKFFSKSFAKQAFNQVVSVGSSSSSSLGKFATESGCGGASGAFSSHLAGCSRDELAALTSDKIYDAFISYDKSDEPFVMQHISAELECGQPQYRIADRFRDLPLPSSAYMAEAITSVIGCSHRTIVCLTRAYLQNEWCRFELRSAISELAADKTHKIIAILLEPDCLHLSELDGEMRSLLAAIGLMEPQNNNNNQQDQSQLVQLASDNNIDASPATNQLVATLTSAGRVVSSKHKPTGQPRASLISYQDRKFWLRMKQLMPIARPPTQTFTLTTKN